MTKDGKKRLILALTALAEVFNRQLSASVLRLYADVLGGFTDAEVERAMEKCAIECERFPVPADIAKRIQGSKEDRAAIAWESALVHVRDGDWSRPGFKPDSAISRAIGMLGGWQVLAHKPERELTWMRRDFIDCYASATTPTRTQIETSADVARIVGRIGNGD